MSLLCIYTIHSYCIWFIYSYSRVETPQSMLNDDEDAVSEYSENEIIEDQDERPPTPPERQIDVEQAQAVNMPPTPTGTLRLGSFK